MESNDNLKYIIESLLFVSDSPIMLKQIHYIMPDVPMSHIRKAVEALTQEYNEREGSFYLSNVAGGIQLRTRPMYRDWIKRFIKSRPMRLSRAALEALAIVAYKQPVTRSEVDKIRGVDSGAIMRTLVENKLIRIIGRKEVAGRPMLYTTSKRFLEVFDLNDLRDLPSPDDLEIDEAEFIDKADKNPEEGVPNVEKTEPESEKDVLNGDHDNNRSNIETAEKISIHLENDETKVVGIYQTDSTDENKKTQDVYFENDDPDNTVEIIETDEPTKEKNEPDNLIPDDNSMANDASEDDESLDTPISVKQISQG